MTDIDLSGLNIDQLTDLVGKAQSEMASRERKRRKDLRSELERRVTAEGYKMGDIFPELGSASASAARRQKRPAKYRNPQNPRTPGAASVALRSGLRRSSRSAGLTFPPSRRSRCTRSTRNPDRVGVPFSRRPRLARARTLRPDEPPFLSAEGNHVPSPGPSELQEPGLDHVICAMAAVTRSAALTSSRVNRHQKPGQDAGK